MRTLLTTPRSRIIAAFCGLTFLIAVTMVERFSASLVARIALASSAVVLLGWWATKRSSSSARFSRPQRLEVVQRIGLTQRTGVALVEIDGQPYLIVHGDGFARMQPTRRSARAAS